MARMRRLWGKKNNSLGKSPSSARSNNNNSTTTESPGVTNRNVYRVTVPPNTQPGEEFQVYAGSRIVRVKCPLDSQPGQSLQITVPFDQENNSNGSFSSSKRRSRNGEFRPSLSNESKETTEGVRQIAGSNPPAFMVPVPFGTQEGEQFTVVIKGQELSVTCPPNVLPGMSVRIVPPILNLEEPVPQNQASNIPESFSRNQSSGSFPHSNTDTSSEQRQLFEVEVPQGVQPGEPFALLAGGVRVLVTCPENAGPGLKIRFLLPKSLTQQGSSAQRENAANSELQQIRLNYEKDGWTRTLRNTDLKFKWIRLDGNGGVDASFATKHRFHMDKSAYVRRLRFLQGEDPRLRPGLLDFVPATESLVESRIKSTDGRVVVTYIDLARIQTQSFDDKTEWFQEKCAELCVDWNEGHMHMRIRRHYMLRDSVDAVMSLSRKDMRKLWRFEFIGEEGIDAGGLAREWFELVCEEIFDPDFGLWMSSATNQMSMTINPASEYCCDDHLIYYRFLGRVMGKAMLDRQLIKGHMVKHLYKHILGWPTYFKDLESVDEEYYNNLRQLRSMHERGEDISLLALDFTITSEMMGIREEIELIPDGANVEVTNENFPEYVEACLKYKLMGSVKPQLSELLLGFFDVIPEALLTIFDYQELELVMCGLPHIDLDDWKAHTEYSGAFEDLGMHHPKAEWFWEILEDLSDEMRARLLLFVTGTSGVPSRGFGVLQSNDGNIRNFTIHGVSAEICFYPRAHTCFNRIDLPLYNSKQELEERLKLAVTMSATGFAIE